MMSDKAEPAPRSATRNDVAKLAGVSSAVVSYVVNDGPRPVAEATRQRVLDAIDKLGYRPNAAARSLITGRADLIGLIVPDVRNPYFAAMAQQVEIAARERGYTLVLAQSATADLAEVIDALGGRLVAGIITAAAGPPAMARDLRRFRVPVIMLSLAAPLGPFPALWPDFYQGTRAAVRHLVQVHRHTQVAFVTGSEDQDDRERAWRDVLLESGLEVREPIRVPWSMVGGRDAVSSVLADPGVTAVFVASDQQATGLLSGLHQAGRRVPEDLAVASFDGSPEAEFTVPSLTTVAVPMPDMARDAVGLVLGDDLAHGSPYPSVLVVRHSCGCP